jgi:Flp pilus assembly protein TadB
MAMIMTDVVCAIGFIVGIVGLVFALRSGPKARPNAEVAANGTKPASPSDGKALSVNWRVGSSLVSALIVVTVTRWPVAGLLAAAATFSLPAVIRSTASRDATRLTEAVAVWTELLRDTLTASAGLAQAIVATAAVAPEAIRETVARLSERIVSGVPVDDALRAFAAEIDEPSADQVVCALRLAVTSRAQRLVDLLGALADSTREEVAMRLRVEASRASVRSSVRTVICFSLGFVVLLAVFAHSYLAPFGSATGQLVLGFVGACYATGLFLMVRLVRPRPSVQLSRRATPT